MDLGIRGRAAIVTGASRGIGRETARQFLEEGARVMICGRNAESIEKARADLAKQTEEEARRLAARKNSLNRFGKPEALANAIVFLCSKRSSYIIGMSLNLDGGRLKGLR